MSGSKSVKPLSINGSESPNAAILKMNLFYSKNTSKCYLNFKLVTTPMIPNMIPLKVNTTAENMRT